MPKDIQNGVKALSIQSNDSSKTKKTKRRRKRPAYLDEEWLYGYRVKNRHVRLLAEKYGLPWQNDPIGTSFRVHDRIQNTIRKRLMFRGILRRGKSAGIYAFVIDDGRKRLEKNNFSEEQMDRLRHIIGLPEGQKPKWYDHGDNYDENAEYSSDDEEFPQVPGLSFKSKPTAYAWGPQPGSKGSDAGNQEEPSGKSVDDSDDEYDDIDEFEHGSSEESDQDEMSDNNLDGKIPLMG